MNQQWASTAAPPGLSGGRALHGQASEATEARLMEMSAMMDHCQDLLDRMRTLWGGLAQQNNLDLQTPRDMFESKGPEMSNSPEVEGLLWTRYQDLAYDQGCSLGQAVSAPSAMGTQASVVTGALGDRRVSAPVDLSVVPLFAKNDFGMQEPLGLTRPQWKQPLQGVLDKTSPPTSAQLMTSLSAVKNIQKFDSVSSQELSHSPSIRKNASIAGMSTTAQTEVMDGELDGMLDEVSDIEKTWLRSVEHLMRHRGGEANLKKNISEPVRNTEQYRTLGASKRDARVMDMMGLQNDQAAFSFRSDPPRSQTLCKDDHLANYTKLSEMGYNSQAPTFGGDQVFNDIRVPQFASTQLRQHHAGGVAWAGLGPGASPQPAAAVASPATARALAHRASLDAKPEDGVPTLGSMNHAAGTCKPCLFWYQGLCRKGFKCTFCHIRHNHKEVSRIRPSKKTRNLLQQEHNEEEAEGRFRMSF